MSAFLVCPCCTSTWATYNELISHCNGQKFNIIFHCKQPRCKESFFNQEVEKYFDHVKREHAPRPHQHSAPTLLVCPCCRIPYATFNELASHLKGREVDQTFNCNQPGCEQEFYGGGNVEKYLEHVQNEHVI